MLILRDGEQPYSYLEHAIECDGFDGQGKTVRQFRTIRCPKTAKSPNAPCPICDGQRFRRRVRNAANCWDYEQGKVQKLNAGEGIWKPIATTRKMGVDVLAMDWGLMRTGTDRNDTEYTATNLGHKQFNGTITNDQLFDIESDYAPHSIEDMKAIGLVWEEVIVPPSLQFPSLEDALNHVMPNGKYKDQKFSQIWAADQSPKGMINFLATKSDRVTAEKAAAQVILVNLGGAHIPGVPKYNSDGSVSGGAATTAAPAATTTTQPAPLGGINMNTTKSTVTPAATTAAPAQSGDRSKKVDEINGLFGSNPRFVSGGFKLIMDTMKEAGNGKSNIADFSDAELDALMKLCKE